MPGKDGLKIYFLFGKLGLFTSTYKKEQIQSLPISSVMEDLLPLNYGINIQYFKKIVLSFMLYRKFGSFIFYCIFLPTFSKLCLNNLLAKFHTITFI